MSALTDHRIRFVCTDCGARWIERFGWSQERVRYKVRHDCPATHNIGPLEAPNSPGGTTADHPTTSAQTEEP